MKEFNDDNAERRGATGRQLVVRVTDHDCQHEGPGKAQPARDQDGNAGRTHQPGRMKLAEDRIATLEGSEIRRSVYARIVNAVMTAISLAIALHDRWWGK
jgi:hypothetical protein